MSCVPLKSEGHQHVETQDDRSGRRTGDRLRGYVRPGPDLEIGDPAPKLEVKSFVKGEPVKAFEPGKTYVVEFWATWCGPCKTSASRISPSSRRSTRTSASSASASSSRTPGRVKPFVKEMGDKMDYRVAIDAVPDGQATRRRRDGQDLDGGRRGRTASRPPSSSSDGKIAWIGHPMEMEQPLDADHRRHLTTRRRRRSSRRSCRSSAKDSRSAQRSGDPKSVLEALDEILSLEARARAAHGCHAPARAPDKLDQQDKALELAKKIAEERVRRRARGPQLPRVVDRRSRHGDQAECRSSSSWQLETAGRPTRRRIARTGPIADTLAQGVLRLGRRREGPRDPGAGHPPR